MFGDEDGDEDDNQDSKPKRLVTLVHVLQQLCARDKLVSHLWAVLICACRVTRPSDDTDSELEEPTRKSKGKRSKSSSKSEKSSKKRKSTRDTSDHDDEEGEKKSKKGKNTFLDSDDEDAHIQVARASSVLCC